MLCAKMLKDVALVLLCYCRVKADEGDKLCEVEELSDHVVVLAMDVVEVLLEAIKDAPRRLPLTLGRWTRYRLRRRGSAGGRSSWRR